MHDWLVARGLHGVIVDAVITGRREIRVRAGEAGVIGVVEKKKFQFAEAPLAVYEGDAQIKLPVRAARNAVKGMRPLPLTLRVQACDSEKCYPPANLNSYISVEVK